MIAIIVISVTPCGSRHRGRGRRRSRRQITGENGELLEGCGAIRQIEAPLELRKLQAVVRELRDKLVNRALPVRLQGDGQRGIFVHWVRLLSSILHLQP
jgi:hypothetical protein